MADHRDARTYFDSLWMRGDPWDLETSEYDLGKYERELELLGGRRFGRALEIGCGAGVFTRRLATIADRVLAIDVSEEAIKRAKAAVADDRIEYRVADIVGFDPAPDGPWDLSVLSETIYYVGWRYSFFEVGWMARQLFESTRKGGLLLMTNTLGTDGHYLQLKSLLETYRDLFLNTGFRLEAAGVYGGKKADTPMDAMLSLFVKPG
jgi:predicted TPR repeat methyltransferase